MGFKVKRAGFVAGGALAMLGMVAGPAIPAGAAAPPPKDAVGTLSCKVKGSLKFSPPLITDGDVPTTATLKTTLSNCTGTGDGAKIKGGSSLSVYGVEKNDCKIYFNPATPFTTRSGQIKWKVVSGWKQKYNNSTITFTAGTGAAGPPIYSDQSGSATAGSFNGDAAAAHAAIKQTALQIGKSCAPPKGKGVKVLTLLYPNSTFSLS